MVELTEIQKKELLEDLKNITEDKFGFVFILTLDYKDGQWYSYLKEFQHFPKSNSLAITTYFKDVFRVYKEKLLKSASDFFSNNKLRIF